MTNKEYLTKSLSGLGISDDDIDIILLKGSIDGNAEVQIEDCDKAVYNRISILFKSGVQNIQEGGYSITWNLEAVKLYYTALCNELGYENVLVGRAKIRNRSNIW